MEAVSPDVDRVISDMVRGAARMAKQAAFAAAYGKTVINPPSSGRGVHLSDFILDRSPFKAVTLRCPACGNTNPSYLTLESNPSLKAPEDLMKVEVKCLAPHPTAPNHTCEAKVVLEACLTPGEALNVYNECRHWLASKGVCPPTSPSAYRSWHVLYARGGGVYQCIVSLPDTGQVPSQRELEAECQQKYASEIDKFQAGTIAVLPPGCVEHVPPGPPAGIGHWMNPNASGTATQMLPHKKNSCTGGPFCTCSKCSTLWSVHQKFKVAMPPPIPGTSKDEASKPEGTRDVEKFLKQERDKQLRELFGC